LRWRRLARREYEQGLSMKRELRGKKRLGTRELAAFLSSFDAIVSAGLAVNPTGGAQANYLEKKSTTLPSRCRDRRSRRSDPYYRPQTSAYSCSPTTRPSLARMAQAPPTEISGCFQGRRTRPITSRRSAPNHRHSREIKLGVVSLPRIVSASRPLFCGDRLDATATN